MATDPSVNIGITDTGVAAGGDDIRVLLVGIKLASGSLAANTPTVSYSTADTIGFAGEGSQLVQMDRALRGFNKRLNVTVLAMAEPAGAAAAGKLVISGQATVTEPLILQIEDQLVTVPVEAGDDPDDVTASAEAELAKDRYAGLHVTAAQAGMADDELAITARSKGVHGNSIGIRVVKTPAGLSIAVTAMTGGTGAPDLASALATLGPLRYNYVVLPDTDATNLAAFDAVAKARWDRKVALDMHGIAAKRDTVSNLASFGSGLDTKHLSVFGDPSVPTNPWVQAAVVAAARASNPNPKASLYTVDLIGITAPDSSQYLDPDDRNTLLAAGISCYHYVQNTPRVRRFVTLAKTNDDGQTSNAFEDVETKLTVSEIRVRDKALLERFIGYTWTEDANSTQYDFDVLIIDPDGIREALITQYRSVYLPAGWIGRFDEWEANLTVVYTGKTSGSYTSEPSINGILYDLSGTIAFQ